VNPVLAVVAARAEGIGGVPLGWLETLDGLFASEPPAFTRRWYGDLYRRYAVDPAWLSRSLIANSKKEADGSRKLRHLADGQPGLATGALLHAHARDEATHAALYFGMRRVLFADDNRQGVALPYAGSPHRSAFVTAADSGSPNVIDELIQINVGELRTFVNQLLMQPIIGILAESVAGGDAVVVTVDELLNDELAHIVYTGRLLEAGLADAPGAAGLVARRLRDFERYTLGEVGVDGPAL
jgi:hypothetical protein